MAWCFGVFLLVTGLPSLLFNELTVNIRRAFKPWWRDDENPRYDRYVKQFHRIVVFVGAVVSIEFGLWLIEQNPIDLTQRTIAYSLALIPPIYRIVRERREPLMPTV